MSVQATPGTRTRRALWAVTIATSITAVGWLWYSRPFREAARIGVDAARLQRTGRCMSLRGQITCVTTVQTTAPPEVTEQIDIDPWTRRLVQARLTWWMSDSAKWAARIDSIRRAVGPGHGSAIACSAASGTAVAEAWTRGGREFRLYAFGPLEDRNEDRVIGKQWLVNIDLVDKPPPDCDLYLTRRPTIAEMDSMFRAWMREHLAF